MLNQEPLRWYRFLRLYVGVYKLTLTVARVVVGAPGMMLLSL